MLVGLGSCLGSGRPRLRPAEARGAERGGTLAPTGLGRARPQGATIFMTKEVGRSWGPKGPGTRWPIGGSDFR